MRVVKKFEFDAAHYLPGYKGKCSKMHGHHWVVWVGVSGSVNKETGMVIDFNKLKEIVNPIIEKFDHSLLNDFLEIPTAENIAKYIAVMLANGFPSDLKVDFVRVYETEDSYAEVVQGN